MLHVIAFILLGMWLGFGPALGIAIVWFVIALLISDL